MGPRGRGEKEIQSFNGYAVSGFQVENSSGDWLHNNAHLCNTTEMSHT